MAMNVGNPNAEMEVMIDVNTTPLIDVMLVLIVMLIITIPIQTHAVKLNMPVGNPPPPTEPPQVVKLDIDFDGTIFWNGEQIEPAALDDRFKGSATMAVQPEFHLRPNKLVTYKHVAHVMAAAQRDGITKIGLVGAEQFLD
ncbi:MAG TPA: biopolymer transporter ExbD [Usitatibacter sp.]|nr:biopolymer transporter ExbD [Usitatibacter sp.]